MTIILNEIHLLDGLSRTLVVSAADRRLTRPDGGPIEPKSKLFMIPGLLATVSYFGVAAIHDGTYISDWLPSYMGTAGPFDSLERFAVGLHEQLRQLVPVAWLKEHASGFHICGYDAATAEPQFWIIGNATGMRGRQYQRPFGAYRAPTREIVAQGRPDRMRLTFGTAASATGTPSFPIVGWEGHSVVTPRQVKFFCNGDVRAFSNLWENFDSQLVRLLGTPGFPKPRTPEDYRRYVRLKMQWIVAAHQELAEEKLIGDGLDIIVLDPRNLTSLGTTVEA